MSTEVFDIQRLREEIDTLVSEHGFDPYDPEDQDIWASAIEGETSFEDVLNKLLDLRYKALADAEACKMWITDLKAREDRHKFRAEGLTKAMEKVMRMANQKSFKTALATFTIRAGTQRVEIEDEAAIPTQLTTTKTITSPDKKAIGEALKAGEIVPGAVLVTGPETLSIRTK